MCAFTKQKEILVSLDDSYNSLDLHNNESSLVGPPIQCNPNGTHQDNMMETDESEMFTHGFQNLTITESAFEVNGPAYQTNDIAGFEAHNTMSAREKAKDLLLFLPDDDGDTSLHITLIQEDDMRSEQIINRAPDFLYLSIPNNLGQTPTHLSAILNSSKILRRLVCAGADMNHQDRDGNTPLHVACFYGYLDCVRQLLTPIDYSETIKNRYPIPFVRIPQNLNVKNYEGLTCLHLAVMQGRVDIVRFLLESGADVNVVESKSGRTALHIASDNGQLDMVSLLLTHEHIHVDVKNYNSHTPSQLASSRGHKDVVETLLQRGAVCMCHYVNDGSDDSSDNFESD